MKRIATAERVCCEPSDNFVYQRSRLAYNFASGMVNGRILEIGTGSGYGIEIIAPKASKFITIDKELPSIDGNLLPNNVELISAEAPILPFADSSFDCVISFQVIEHIEDDILFVAEISRVLKLGGIAIISTPNAQMSLTRNPWHIREYKAEQFQSLLATRFDNIKQYGVTGNSNVMEYFNKNRTSVEKITRFDIFDLQHRLPSWMLRIPYDILNRFNRRKLLKENRNLTQSIKMDDYAVESNIEQAFDFIYVAIK